MQIFKLSNNHFRRGYINNMENKLCSRVDRKFKIEKSVLNKSSKFR